jgi:hypothetical protein
MMPGIGQIAHPAAGAWPVAGLFNAFCVLCVFSHFEPSGGVSCPKLPPIIFGHVMWNFGKMARHGHRSAKVPHLLLRSYGWPGFIYLLLFPALTARAVGPLEGENVCRLGSLAKFYTDV